MSSIDFTEDQKIQWTKYNALIEQAKQLLLDAENGKICMSQLKVLADQGLEVLVSVENLEIAMLDMKLMQLLFQIFQQNIRTINPEKVRFARGEYARKLLRGCKIPVLTETQQESRDFSMELLKKLSGLAHSQLCYQAPNFNVALGAVHATEQVKKAPKQREKRVKDKIEPLTQPEMLTHTVGKTLEETVVEVANILEQVYIANDEKPVNFLNFVLHPTSFAFTVENIFHTSFLINNNKVNVFVDEESELPMIEPIPQTTERSEVTREGKAAMIMTITPDEWKEAVDVFEITEPMIKLQYQIQQEAQAKAEAQAEGQTQPPVPEETPKKGKRTRKTR